MMEAQCLVKDEHLGWKRWSCTSLIPPYFDWEHSKRTHAENIYVSIVVVITDNDIVQECRSQHLACPGQGSSVVVINEEPS